MALFGRRRSKRRPEADHEEKPKDNDEKPGRTLLVDGKSHPLHEDFDMFAQDAAKGRIALWKTTIEELSFDDVRRLYDVPSEAFGPEAPEAKAVLYAPFYCLSCMHGYPPSLIMMRDEFKKGAQMTFSNSDPEIAKRNLQAMEMTACIICGGEDAVLFFDPAQRE